MRDYGIIRAQLLSPRSRHETFRGAALGDVVRSLYGPEYPFGLYGLSLSELIEHEIPLCGRSIVECTDDAEAVHPAGMVRAVFSELPVMPVVTVDLFAGTGNLLHWASQNSPACRCGFELDSAVYGCTKSAIDKLDLRLPLYNSDWTKAAQFVPSGQSRTLLVVAPPWGTAFTPAVGLSVEATQPPIADILAWVAEESSAADTYALIQLTERVVGRVADSSWTLIDRVLCPLGPVGLRPSYSLYRLRESKR